MFCSDGLRMLSNASIKSMKLIVRGAWSSLHFSMMRHSINICSTPECFGWNPVCCSCSSLSAISCMRLKITWQEALPRIDRSTNRMHCCQKWHCVSSGEGPFSL